MILLYYMITSQDWEKIQNTGIHLESISKARQKNNEYLRRYGQPLWVSAILTAYAGGGFEMLKEMHRMPLKYQRLLLDAYEWVEAKRALNMIQAASRPYMKKQDGKKLVGELMNKVNGNAARESKFSNVLSDAKSGYKVEKR